jgi:hypothetical protein
MILIVAGNMLLAVALMLACSLGLSVLPQRPLPAAGRIVHAGSNFGIAAQMSLCFLLMANLLTCPILLV